MTVQGKDQFHFGVIVADIEASAKELTRVAGLHWSPRIDTEVPLWTPDEGVVLRRMRAMYSVEEPHLELIAAIPGTIWALDPNRPVQHLGFWADDLVAESEELERQGLPRVACAMTDGKIYGFVYHVSADGMLLELVDRTAFPDWQGFLRGEVKFTSAAS